MFGIDVLLQTVLLQDETRYYIFYPNEMGSDTNLLREAGETINDANDRAIRSAAKFYSASLEGHGSLCLITNDKGNQIKAKAEGINTMSMREYVGHYLHDNPELLDLLSASTSSDSADNHQDSTKYVPHLNATDISIGIKSKRYHRGVIRCKDSWMNGYVIVHTNDGEPRKSINVIGEASINRAVDGDVVAVEVISQAEANSIKSIFKKSTTVTDDVNP